MNNHITGIKTIQYVEEFCKKLENEGINEKSIRDFKSHFARWLNIELKKESQSKPLQSEREKRMEGVRQLKADSAAILEHLNIKLS
jgi:limonene-1,2-epoxide hydrolase